MVEYEILTFLTFSSSKKENKAVKNLNGQNSEQGENIWPKIQNGNLR